MGSSETIQEVRIANIEEILAPIKTLTDMQMAMVRMEGSQKASSDYMQELNVQFEETRKQLQQFIIMGHECLQKEKITQLQAAVEFLKSERDKTVGASYWTEKFIDAGKYIILLITGAFVLYVLKGGTIT